MRVSTSARIGVDVGGTKIEVAVVGPRGATLLRERVPTPKDNYEETVRAIAALVRRAQDVAGAQAPIGIGTPGSLSKTTGRIINANSTALIGKPFKGDVESALGRTVRMANDANCLALSEATDGAATNAHVVFAAILGTGVGGGVAIGGRIIEGPNGIAGEWGHNPLPWPQPHELPGPPCYCGKSGCIETFLSGPSLQKACERIGEEAAFNEYEERLARSLASVVNILDPDVIVIGGGVSNRTRLYDDVPRLLPQYVFSDCLRTRITQAAHGDSSGVRGAAMLWPEGASDE